MEWKKEWINVRFWTLLHGSFKSRHICCVPSGCYRRPREMLLLGPRSWNRALPCLDRTSFWQLLLSRGRMDPLAYNQSTTASSNKTPVLPKEAVFLLTRYNLGSTAMRGALLGNVLQRPSYIASLSDSPAEALWKEWVGTDFPHSSCCTIEKWTWFQWDDPLLFVFFYSVSPVPLSDHCLCWRFCRETEKCKKDQLATEK